MSLLSFAKKLKKGDATDNKKKPVAKKEKKTPARDVVAVQKEKRGEASAAAAGGSWVLKVGLEPLISEKSVGLQEQGVVAFRVASGARKQHIGLAVQEKYGVKALAVRTMAKQGKPRRRGQSYGRSKHWKKAYVTVDDVQKISTGP